MMKKSLVTVSVILVLGAAWTGASWYTGKMLEQHIGDMVTQANVQLTNHYPQAGLKLTYEDFYRGVFNSTLRLVVQADTAAADPLLKPGDRVAIVENIEHGPFPVAQLKKLNLVPSMAWIHSELEETPVLQQLFKATQEKSLFNADTRLSYSGDTRSVVNIIPVNYQKNTSKLMFNGARLELDIAKGLRAFKANASSSDITISSQKQPNKLQKITFGGIKLKSDIHAGNFQFGIGDQQLLVASASIDIDGKPAAQLNGFELQSKVGEDAKNIKADVNYSVDSLKVKGQDLGSGKLNVKLDNIDSQALKQFFDNYQQQRMQLLQPSTQLNSRQYQQQETALLLANLPTLLKGEPTLTINPLSWKNSQGESIFNLQLALKVPTASMSAQTEDQLITPWVSSLDAKLTIPMQMATKLTTQMARVQDYSDKDAEKLGDQQVQALAAMGQMFKLTTVKDNAITSNFYYADNQVNLNGENMALQDFAGLFGVVLPH